MPSSIPLVQPRFGAELVRALVAEGDRVFSTARAQELADRIGLKEPSVSEVLVHLTHMGWFARLRRDLYALAPTVPGVTPVHEFEVAMTLVRPAAISQSSALHYHGLTEQVPRDVFVLTTSEGPVPSQPIRDRRRRGDGSPEHEMAYRFVKVKPERFFGTERVWVGEAQVTITDAERSLLDGLARPRYCGGIGEVLHAFGERGDALKLERIIGYALRLSRATVKRLGWVLERQGMAADRLAPLAELPLSSLVPLDLAGPRGGRLNQRWMILENLPRAITE